MTRLWLDFEEIQDAEEVAATLEAIIPNVERSGSEPFSTHVLEQSDLANHVAKSDRGRQALISSAEAMSERWGPGVRLRCVLANVTCHVVVSRSWVRVTGEALLPSEARERLRGALRSLPNGVLEEWDASKSEDTGENPIS